MRPHSIVSLRNLCMLGLAALAWINDAGAQDIYKWVDSSGVTEYSTLPPPSNVAVTLIRPSPTPIPDAAVQAQAKRALDDGLRRSAERARQQAQQQAHDDAERRDAAARLQRCARARERLGVMTSGRPVYRRNDRGERAYIDDSERDAETARVRDEVATHCGSGEFTHGAQDAATQRRIAERTETWRCNAARDLARDLESGGSRVAERDVEQAREAARRACAGMP